MSDAMELDYRKMMQRALKGIVREILEQVSEYGFPGDHHAFLTFRTDMELVTVPTFLRERYPEEMTIVLQNQFWDLFVDDDGISVTLAFNGSRHRIGMPWEAVTAFVDPEAEFGLQFKEDETETSPLETDRDEGAAAESTVATEAKEPDDPVPAGSDSENVVSIDRFRKK